jgi:UDP-N-acetylmuramoyl-L-alanyl-D-glutamate--2,6-diaminopimelate ligase
MEMLVQDLFMKIPFAEVISRPANNISGVATDSNLIEPGDLFIPLIGEKHNGYRFINQALQKGASAVAGDEIRVRKNHLACIYLPNAQKHVPFISANVYANPSKRLQVIGITGTNGKTATAHMIEAMLREVRGNKVGYIGTNAYRWAGSFQEASLTTPAAPQLQRFFRKMVDAGIESAVVECSSHGIQQRRLDYTQFDVAVFTNLTNDHLDYHGSFVSYRNAKWKLFSSLLSDSNKKNKYAVFNIDDPTGRSWSREDLPTIKTITFSTESGTRATVYPEHYKQFDDAMEVKIRVQGRTIDFRTPLLGKFNLQNILATLSVAHAIGLDLDQAATVLSRGVYIPGRLEKIIGTGDIHIFIDFAHSEDALAHVLDTLNQIKKGRVITVFGCGGGTDKFKRPKMGKVAVEKSDVVVATSDNPREENPEQILDEIFSGIDQSHFTQKEIFRITKRQDAIAHALRMAKQHDIVLIAGKGHETFQEIDGFKHPFDDKKVVKEWMNQK